MKKITYPIYTLILMSFSLTVFGAIPAETKHLSNAVFVFFVSFVAAISVTYYIWRWNNTRKKQNAPKIVNRPPARRPMVAYKSRKNVQGQVRMGS
jgi:hypothetical protein